MLIRFVVVLVIVCCAASGRADDSLTVKPFVKTLPPDTVHYVPLLEPPVSKALESGCVNRLPGTSGSEHTTGDYEEMLVILRGEGEVVVAGGEPMAVHAGEIAYIPPHTKHFVRNTGDEVLQYVFIVTDTEREHTAPDTDHTHSDTD